MNNKLELTNHEFQQLMSVIKSLEERFDIIDIQLNRIEQKLSSIENKLTVIENRLFVENVIKISSSINNTKIRSEGY